MENLILGQSGWRDGGRRERGLKDTEAKAACHIQRMNWEAA